MLFDETVHVMDDSDDELALEPILMVCAVAGIYGRKASESEFLTISFPL